MPHVSACSSSPIAREIIAGCSCIFSQPKRDAYPLPTFDTHFYFPRHYLHTSQQAQAQRAYIERLEAENVSLRSSATVAAAAGSAAPVVRRRSGEGADTADIAVAEAFSPPELHHRSSSQQQRQQQRQMLSATTSAASLAGRTPVVSPRTTHRKEWSDGDTYEETY